MKEQPKPYRRLRALHPEVRKEIALALRQEQVNLPAAPNTELVSFAKGYQSCLTTLFRALED